MLNDKLIEQKRAQPTEEQREARKGLLKMIIRFSLYVVGAIGVGVAVIFWFIVTVMLMPFTEEGRR